MKSYKIKPDSGHPYTHIRTDVAHKKSCKPSSGRRGDIVLDVLQNSGKVTDLSFYNEEIEEVK
jgi:hypothetical protein